MPRDDDDGLEFDDDFGLDENSDPEDEIDDGEDDPDFDDDDFDDEERPY